MALSLHRTTIVAPSAPASSSGDAGERLVIMRDEFEEGGDKQSGEGVCAASRARALPGVQARRTATRVVAAWGLTTDALLVPSGTMPFLVTDVALVQRQLSCSLVHVTPHPV